MAFKIHQIYFRPDQLPNLDKSFIPYDNSKNPRPDLREFMVFKKAYEEGQVSGSDYYGYLSWLFTKKSNLTGAEFIAFCERNPGYDVYFVNPFPTEIYHGNMWHHGENHHEGMAEIVQHIFDTLNYGINVRGLPYTVGTHAFCNFWVGNAKFWKTYMDFALPVYNYIFNEMPQEYRDRIFDTADKSRNNLHHFSFIFERIFTTLILTNKDITFLGYEYSREELLKSHTSYQADLVLGLRALEAKGSPVAPTLQNDPLARAALYYYGKYTTAQVHLSGFKLLAYAFLTCLWRLIPYREKLKKNAFINSIFSNTKGLFYQDQYELPGT